jgi:hypothetical protein
MPVDPVSQRAEIRARQRTSESRARNEEAIENARLKSDQQKAQAQAAARKKAEEGSVDVTA